jgi:DNA ligase-associated metallophosphoesterase
MNNRSAINAKPPIATASALRLNGADILADPTGAIYWPAQETIAVADLHLEKGSSFARQGSMLPPYDTRTSLDRLAAIARRLSPKRIICIGDSFHDQDAGARLAAADRQLLKDLTASCQWIWICGNHDPHPPRQWGGDAMTELMMGPLVFRHEAIAGRAPGEVSGHFHPKIGLSVRGRQIGGRCFVHDGRRLILPAFGAYAGGLDARDPAIARLFPDGFQVDVIGQDRLHRLSVQ